MTIANTPTKLEMYQQQVLSPGNIKALSEVLPAHVPASRFIRNVTNALMTKPSMMDYDPRLLWRECSKAAALGLLIDPQFGEAYIVEVWDNSAKKKIPQLRVGYRGIIKLARQSGEITKIYARTVHANDPIECVQGLREELIHKPVLFSDRGAVIGWYAVVEYDDGTTDFEPMSREEVLRIRNRSDAWKAFESKRITTTPWFTDEDEMAKKTVIKRLLKRCPQSPDVMDAMRLDNRDETPAEGLEAPRRASRLDRVRATIDAQAEDETQAPAQEPQDTPSDQGAPPAPPLQDDAWGALSGDPGPTDDGPGVTLPSRRTAPPASGGQG